MSQALSTYIFPEPWKFMEQQARKYNSTTFHKNEEFRFNVEQLNQSMKGLATVTELASKAIEIQFKPNVTLGNLLERYMEINGEELELAGTKVASKNDFENSPDMEFFKSVLSYTSTVLKNVRLDK